MVGQPVTQGTAALAGERQTDRHAMQSEVGYLFSGLWKGRKMREGKKGEE